MTSLERIQKVLAKIEAREKARSKFPFTVKFWNRSWVVVTIVRENPAGSYERFVTDSGVGFTEYSPDWELVATSLPNAQANACPSCNVGIGSVHQPFCASVTQCKHCGATPGLMHSAVCTTQKMQSKCTCHPLDPEVCPHCKSMFSSLYQQVVSGAVQAQHEAINEALFESTPEVKCTCDFYTQVMPYGCVCEASPSKRKASGK